LYYKVQLDNSGIVHVVNKGCSRSRQTNKILKSLYKLQGQQGIWLVMEYVALRDNISDALSRGDIPAFL
ncbi:hypothetical protein C8R42DRAFT_542767, partial [Lentinula raphanica]